MGLSQEHFKKFYKKIIFLNQNIGKKEVRKERNVYFDTFTEDNKIVVCTAYKETIVDDFVYFKVPGYIGKLSYGNWYNKKYGTLEISINPDEDFVGEKTSIKELLLLIEDYIRNNYFEYSKKINKFIYGTNENQKHKVKYKTENIFSMDNVKTISVVEAKIDDEVVKELKKYKNLYNLRTSKCEITSKEYVNALFISDSNSTINSLNMFNELTGTTLILSGTKIKNSFKPLTLHYSSIHLTDIDIDFELFILLTNFIGLHELVIDGYKLNEIETLLLPSFVNLTELELEAKTKSLDFLRKMPLLTTIRSNFEITDDSYIEYLKLLYKELLDKYFDLGEEFLQRFLINYHVQKMTEIKKEYKKYVLPRISLLKWQGIFENSTEEDIVKRIEMFKKIPLSQRNEILNGGSLKFIETDLSDSYKMLGIDLPDNKDLEEYKSTLIGPYGKYLYMMQSFYGTFTAPIIGPNGKLLETIEFRNEKDVVIPKHEVRKEISYVNSKDIIFEYFYNRQVSNTMKIKYLINNISRSSLFLCDDEFAKIRIYNEELQSRKSFLQNKEHSISFSYLISSPSYAYRTVETMFRGEKNLTLEKIPDPYYQKGDFNLFSVISRHRTFESVKRQITKEFDEKNICEEERNLIIADIKELIDEMNELDLIEKKVIDELAYIESKLNKSNKELMEVISQLDLYNILIDDIEKILNQYDLSLEQKEMFINYILLKQTSYLKADEEREEEIENQMRILDNYDGVSSILFFLDSVYDCISPKEAYEKGDITESDYKIVEEYIALQSELSNIQKRKKERLSIPREKWYESVIEKLDALTEDDLKKIKKSVAITNDYEMPFYKFVDYIYYYMTGKYPAWIRTELMKYKNIEEECVSKILKQEVDSEKIHVYSYKKVNKNPVL